MRQNKNPEPGFGSIKTEVLEPAKISDGRTLRQIKAGRDDKAEIWEAIRKGHPCSKSGKD
jgi:hypothetical protein